MLKISSHPSLSAIALGLITVALVAGIVSSGLGPSESTVIVIEPAPLERIDHAGWTRAGDLEFRWFKRGECAVGAVMDRRSRRPENPASWSSPIANVLRLVPSSWSTDRLAGQQETERLQERFIQRTGRRFESFLSRKAHGNSELEVEFRSRDRPPLEPVCPRGRSLPAQLTGRGAAVLAFTPG